MNKLSLLFILCLPACSSYVLTPSRSSFATIRDATRARIDTTKLQVGKFDVEGEEVQLNKISRRNVLTNLPSWMLGVLMLLQQAEVARADVSEGNALPKEAAQFSRVIRLKGDIAAVKKRVAENDLEKREWESVGSFLRMAYSTGDDMKAVAAGIASPDNKKRAMEDIDQLRKYAHAGDVSVSKQDPKGFVAVADKMMALVEDFLDSLSDVPDEI